MANFTEKIRARRLLAQALAKQPERVEKANLLLTDLEVVSQQGQLAEDADKEQRTQLSSSSADVSEHAEAIAAVFATESHVRDVVPVIVNDLEKAGHTADARFLGTISFARFRIRELKPDATAGSDAPADAAVAKKLERVEREDNVARLDGLAGFIGAIRAPERAEIIKAFEARKMSADTLAKLQADAKALAEHGKNYLLAAEATARESAAVLAQGKQWQSIRRLLRRAVKGDQVLERMLGTC